MQGVTIELLEWQTTWECACENTYIEVVIVHKTKINSNPNWFRTRGLWGMWWWKNRATSWFFVAPTTDCLLLLLRRCLILALINGSWELKIMMRNTMVDYMAGDLSNCCCWWWWCYATLWDEEQEEMRLKRPKAAATVDCYASQYILNGGSVLLGSGGGPTY